MKLRKNEIFEEKVQDKWIVSVDEDFNIKFPEELIEKVGWKENDTIIWTDNLDGSFSLRKEQ